MRLIILVILFLFSSKSFAQSHDSLINELCKTLKENKNIDDSIKMKLVLNKHIFPYLRKAEKGQAYNTLNLVDMRAQRHCKEFAELVSRLNPVKSDWIRINERPQSKANKKICKDFEKTKRYKYLESNGDSVTIKIEQGFWIDNFKDGSFSKLKFKWLNDCEFQIEFVESNNEIRKNFSKPGDKYNYQILERTDTYYFMSAEIVGENQFMTFKLYY